MFVWPGNVVENSWYGIFIFQTWKSACNIEETANFWSKKIQFLLWLLRSLFICRIQSSNSVLKWSCKGHENSWTSHYSLLSLTCMNIVKINCRPIAAAYFFLYLDRRERCSELSPMVDWSTSNRDSPPPPEAVLFVFHVSQKQTVKFMPDVVV